MAPHATAPSAASDPGHAAVHEAETPRSTLVKNAGALFILLAVTVGANFIDLGSLNVAVALLIALVKAALILWIFMEVRHRGPMLWLFAGAGFFWLVLLLVMMMGDYASRSALPPNWLERTGKSNHVDFPAAPLKPTR